MSLTKTQLLPITLKEASLDSPTFRGTVQHIFEQVDHIEKWLDSYLKATQRLCDGVKGIEELVNIFVQKSIPIEFLESMLDYDYTHLAMRRFVEGSREYWGHVSAVAKRLEANVVEPLKGLERGELRSFKEIRRQWESSQAKYDQLLFRYAAQSKSKDPSSLREDAFQLYESRKTYLKASCDFCVTAPLLRASLDRTITLALCDQWRELNNLRHRGDETIENFNIEMLRIKAWSDGLEACERVLKKELIMQRRAIEEQVKKETQPARDLDEYTASTVAYLSSKGMPPGGASPTEKSEKQGWLFMRSMTSKPTKIVWVRRWFFVRGGVFGYLMQGYKNGQVEESERTGVLLCNVKAAFQEERRFCFEVKTKDTTIVLQAETQAQLTSWISVFEQAKRQAVNSTASMAAQASSIIPPSAPPPELMAKEHLQHDENLTMSFDRSLTLPLTGMGIPMAGGVGSRGVDGNKGRDGRLDKHQPPATPVSAIGALMSATHGQFPMDLRSPMPFSPFSASVAPDINYVMAQAQPSPGSPRNGLAPMTLADGPAPTALQKAAAVTVSLADPESAKPKSPKPKSPRDVTRPIAPGKHKKAISLDMGVAQEGHTAKAAFAATGLTKVIEDDIFPPNYPQSLRVQDNHFRLLFPKEDVHQPVLLVFLAAWPLDDRREIPGRCFVTGKVLYFYSHAMGLVFKKETPLGSIESVSGSPGKDADYVILHLKPKDPDDSDYEDGAGNEDALKIMVKTFLENVKVLQRRLHMLVTSVADGEEKDKDGGKACIGGTARVLDRLVAIEQEVEKEERDTGEGSESWEEVSVGGRGEQHNEVMKRAQTELVVGRLKQSVPPPNAAPRLVLPTSPVEYIPPRMDKKALEKEFEVSAKALFHLMFGDRSVLFQALYHERRAKDIYQGPWFRLDNGRMKRDFTYEIENTDFFRRAKRTTVVDYQTIEKRDDYLCYIVTDRKTPWHLPLKDQFMLVSKIAITYVSSSKCKLSIWTTVDWTSKPAFSIKGIVQRQALDDLDTDAADLCDAVARQIPKLGSANRTKNAISIFGLVGEPHGNHAPDHASYQGNPSAHPNRQRVTQRSLTYMLIENVVSLGESALSTIVMWLAQGVKAVCGVVSAQRVLFLMLAASVVGNMLLSSRSTVNYWAERKARGLLEEVGVKPNKMMSKAVYLRDLEEVIRNGTELAVAPNSQCFSKFRDLATQIDINSHADYAIDSIGYRSTSTRATARNLLRTRQNLGTYRHDLLVAIRMVNSLEKRIVHAEWENWLVEEGKWCKMASYMLREKRGREMARRRRVGVEGGEEEGSEEGNKGKGKEKEKGEGRVEEGGVVDGNDEEEEDEDGVVEEVAAWVKQYCDSCEVERRGVWEKGKTLEWI